MSSTPHPSVTPAWSRQDEANRKPVPAPVVRLAAGRVVRQVWENAIGGLTFEVGAGAERCFDLGDLGVGDRWADLAVATWSSEWNYGPGWEELLLSAYGVAPDPDRTRYYRLLWDLGP